MANSIQFKNIFEEILTPDQNGLWVNRKGKSLMIHQIRLDRYFDSKKGKNKIGLHYIYERFQNFEK